jgi:hypothetical protein
MSLSSERVAVDDTSGGTALNAGGTNGLTLRIHNVDATESVRLGASGVTFAAGYELAADEKDTIVLRAGDVLFAIADAATTVNIDVVRT